MAKLTLQRPLQLGKIEVTELNFRDHTIAEDYLAFDKQGGVATMIALIASVSGTDEALIRRLDGRDYMAAKNIVDNLLNADSEEVEKK